MLEKLFLQKMNEQNRLEKSEGGLQIVLAGLSYRWLHCACRDKHLFHYLLFLPSQIPVSQQGQGVQGDSYLRLLRLDQQPYAVPKNIKKEPRTILAQVYMECISASKERKCQRVFDKIARSDLFLFLYIHAS